MRFAARIVSITSFLLFFGCASYTLEPLPVNHPAHPQAAVAAAPSPSKTLVYSRVDIPVRSAAAEQGGHDAHHGSDAPAEKTAIGEGKVIAVVPSSSQLVIAAWPDQRLHGLNDDGVSNRAREFARRAEAGTEGTICHRPEKKSYRQGRKNKLMSFNAGRK